MDFYYYIAITAILSQVFFLVQAYNNYRFALAKYKRSRPWFRPKAVLIIPCKGVDADFGKNIASFFAQDYENYLLWFVVADEDDPAYEQLCRLKDELEQNSKALEVRVWLAGQCRTGSQKNHNLLYCCRALGRDVEVLAFADSDICVRSDWLSHLVYPLHQRKNGVASGYRWFIPKENNAATLALSALNAKVAQLLGNTRFNQVWGGSMALRVKNFYELRIDKIWSHTISDDLSLSYAIKKAGLKVVFVPASLAASYENINWAKLFEFGRRQFLITRVSAAKTWWLGLFFSAFSVLGLWGGTALALYASARGEKHLPVFAAVPVVFLLTQITRAVIRQSMIGKLLKKDRQKMKAAMLADILLCWFWTLLMLCLIVSSAFGRTIRWRGIKYKLAGPTETIVIETD
jgi:cellulose synthase/poly-beta-1,6-N-acetylglucosamine synthase-like glycosyltransferase